MVVAKVVDVILVSGFENEKRHSTERLKYVYTLGNVVHLPEQFKFFGISVSQDKNASFTISNDDKLQHITPYCIPRLRRKNVHDNLNAVELHSFQSVNVSLGFLGMCVSPFAAFCSSHLQQTKGPAIMHDLIRQISQLKDVKRLGTTSAYKRPSAKRKHERIVTMFADAGRPSSHG